MDDFAKRFSNYVNALTDRNTKPGNISKLGLSFPPKYEVYLLGSADTPEDLISVMLQEFFHKNFKDSMQLVDDIKINGQILCGVYTRDIAETKVIQVTDFICDSDFLVDCIMKKSGKNVIKKS